MDNFSSRMEKLWSFVQFVRGIRLLDDTPPLDQYLQTKTISSLSEVEYWTRVYERTVTQTIELA
mgnify:CR=1 FL=1|jgi:hypothetical protein